MNGMGFIIIGIIIILLTLIIRYRKCKKCTVEILATVLQTNHYRSNSHTRYFTTYEYKYNGSSYRFETMGTGQFNMTVHINPNKPKQYVCRKDGSITNIIILVTLGIFFIIFGLLYI